VSEDTGAPERARADSGVRRRRLLTVLLILHWGAVADYVLPATREALDPLPAWLEPAVAAVVPRVVRWTSPITLPYLNLTATRQTWTLFAPYPAEWTNSVRVVPYFPAADGEGWVADTLVLRGPREAPYPHILHHRSFRVMWNLGYERWGAWYRPLFAREMCRTLRDRGGRAPQGVLLLNRWTPIQIPWAKRESSVYDQRLGGFDCATSDEAGRVAWRAYGLPEPVDTHAWGRVNAAAPDSAGAAGDAPPPSVAHPGDAR